MTLFVVKRVLAILALFGVGVSATVLVASLTGFSAVLVVAAAAAAYSAALLLIPASVRSFRSRQRLDASTKSSTLWALDAHVDGRALSQVGRIWPDLLRLTEPEAIGDIITVSVHPESVELWGGRSPRRLASTDSADVTFEPSTSELNGRTYAALSIRVQREATSGVITAVVSHPGSSGFFKLNRDDIVTVLTGTWPRSGTRQ